MKKYKGAERMDVAGVEGFSSKTWAGGQKEILLHPSGLDEPPGHPSKDQFMGIWKELGGSSCGHTYIPSLSCSPRPSHPLFREAGMGWAQKQSLALTGDIDLDGDFSPAHIILRPARHILPIEVTGDIGQGQPQGRQTPRFLGQSKEGKIKKSFSWLGAGGSWAGGWRGAELMSLGNPSGSRWKREGGTGREEVWEKIWQRMALLQSLFTPSPGSLI